MRPITNTWARHKHLARGRHNCYNKENGRYRKGVINATLRATYCDLGESSWLHSHNRHHRRLLNRIHSRFLVRAQVNHVLTSSIGILAGCLLASCGIPQAVKVIREGHARGIALNMMLMLIGGLFCMGLYIYLSHGWDWIIHGEYIISVAVWSISLFYYFFPRVRPWSGLLLV